MPRPPLSNLDELETPHKTLTVKAPATTSASTISKSPSVLLTSVKNEVSYDSLKEDSFHSSAPHCPKGLSEKSSFVASSNYPTSSVNALMQTKNSEKVDNTAMKSRNCNPVTSGNM